jgi:hypothetical protein
VVCCPLVGTAQKPKTPGTASPGARNGFRQQQRADKYRNRRNSTTRYHRRTAPGGSNRSHDGFAFGVGQARPSRPFGTPGAADPRGGGMNAITTRVRGIPAWSLQRKTLELRANVRSVLLEYADYLPFTVRQVFYRLVGSLGYDKSGLACDRSDEHLNRARRWNDPVRCNPRRRNNDFGTTGMGWRWRSCEDILSSMPASFASIGRLVSRRTCFSQLKPPACCRKWSASPIHLGSRSKAVANSTAHSEVRAGGEAWPLATSRSGNAYGASSQSPRPTRRTPLPTPGSSASSPVSPIT